MKQQKGNFYIYFGALLIMIGAFSGGVTLGYAIGLGDARDECTELLDAISEYKEEWQ